MTARRNMGSKRLNTGVEAPGMSASDGIPATSLGPGGDVSRCTAGEGPPGTQGVGWGWVAVDGASTNAAFPLSNLQPGEEQLACRNVSHLRLVYLRILFHIRWFLLFVCRAGHVPTRGNANWGVTSGASS